MGEIFDRRDNAKYFEKYWTVTEIQLDRCTRFLVFFLSEIK